MERGLESTARFGFNDRTILWHRLPDIFASSGLLPGKERKAEMYPGSEK